MYHVDVCMVHMLLSPTPAEVSEFVNAHMRGTRSKDNVLFVVGAVSSMLGGRAQRLVGGSASLLLSLMAACLYTRWLGVSL